MTSALGSLGINMADTDLFITHLHSDHAGLVKQLATSTTRVWMGEADARILMESAQLFRVAESHKAAQRLAYLKLPIDVTNRLQKALADPYGNLSVTIIPYAKAGQESTPQGFGLLEGEDDLWMLTLLADQVEVQPVSPGMIRRAFVELMEPWLDGDGGDLLAIK
jgi:hypothetical protein